MTAFDNLLAATSLDQLRLLARTGAGAASPAQARQLAAHARTLTASRQCLRLAFVHTYTSDLLDPWLDAAAAVQGLDLAAYHAPYGPALGEASPTSALVRHEPQVTVMLLQREDLAPALQRPLAGMDADERERVRRQALAQLREWVSLFRAQPVGQLLVTILPRLSAPGLGLYDAQAERGEYAWWAGFKREFANWLRAEAPATLLLDLDEVMSQVGRQGFFDRRFWYSARYPFAAPAAAELSRRVVAAGVLRLRPKAKVLVLDADNTLWGGIIGEDGMDGIRLGPEYPGNCYVEFQRRILELQQRGLILAMCSKNNAADVDQVLQDHPHMVLRDAHFAARRVNWTTKPENLISLAKELNLGLDAFIFVDDSDHECAAVRHALPQVEVVQVPSKPVDLPDCLDQVARLEVMSLTAEDLAKTAMYAQDRRRRELAEAAGGDPGTGYLERLGMKMSLSVDAAGHVPRLAQLTQKTNQFNLTTQRYDEAQIRGLVADPAWSVADFSLADTFGDSGIVGLALIHRDAPGRARIDTFLMSCRVIGRQAESAFIHALFRRLAGDGVREVWAQYRPTAKNELVRNFLPDHGFEPQGEGRYLRRLDNAPPQREADFPIQVLNEPNP